MSDSPLILRRGVTEEVYLLRFPRQPATRALTAWDALRAGFNNVDVQYWELTEDFYYVSDIWGPICVPKGFITDFASIPGIFQNIVRNDSPEILCGSVVHDFLYKQCGDIGNGKILSFQQSNTELTRCMFYSNAPDVIKDGVFNAVQFGGRSTWNGYCDRLGVPARKV